MTAIYGNDENEQNAPPPPTLAAGLAHIAALYPHLLRYAATARIERLHRPDGWCWGVTVDVKVKG